MITEHLFDGMSAELKLSALSAMNTAGFLELCRLQAAVFEAKLANIRPETYKPEALREEMIDLIKGRDFWNQLSTLIRKEMENATQD